VFTDPDFVPFDPPERPLGLLDLRTLLRNYVEAIPRSAYGQGVTRIRTRLSDVLIVSDPNIIQEILVEKAEAFGRDPATRRSFRPVIGDTSLFLAEGADWRWQRRAVAPIFRHETLLSFVPIFATMAQRQVKRWRAVERTVPIDAAAAMTLVTFEIIVEAMLGGSASLDAERYGRALTDNFDTIPWHIIYTMFLIPDWMPYPHRRRAMRSRDFLHRDIRRIVESRRSIQCSQPDLLDLLLTARDHETGRSMSDNEIVTNLLTFIIAGHETTAVALTWTLWLLAKDQTTQQRVVLVLFIISVTITFAVENMGTATGFPFGHYHFEVGGRLPHVGSIPIIVGPLWFGAGYFSWVVASTLLDSADRRLDRPMNVITLPIVAAFVMTQWDLVIDPPESTISKAWIWHDGGADFGVPLSNYLGWLFTSWLFYQAFALYLRHSTVGRLQDTATEPQTAAHRHLLLCQRRPHSCSSLAGRKFG
jgi:uncharacterized membrane protein